MEDFHFLVGADQDMKLTKVLLSRLDVIQLLDTGGDANLNKEIFSFGGAVLGLRLLQFFPPDVFSIRLPALQFSRECQKLLFRMLWCSLLNLKQFNLLVFSFRPEADVLPQRSLTALKTGSRLLIGCRPIHSYESYPSRRAVQVFSKSRALPKKFSCK